MQPFAKFLNIDINFVEISGNEDFSKLFPLHKVPAFIDPKGFKLTEVIAIIQYLIALSSRQDLAGKTIQDQAQVTRWLSFVNQDMADNWDNYVFEAKTEDAKQIYATSLDNQLKFINNELSTRNWLAVDNYATVADEYFFSWYDSFAGVVGGIDNKYPHLGKWHTEMKKKDEVAIALSKK